MDLQLHAIRRITIYLHIILYISIINLKHFFFFYQKYQHLLCIIIVKTSKYFFMQCQAIFVVSIKSDLIIL